MPTKTPHFGFQAFVSGDYYSATVDKSRFMSIDQHMAFLSDIIGPGRISGWIITKSSSSLEININPGMGIIDRNVTRTFGDTSRTLLDNNIVYIWMKRRPGVIGQTGAFSNIGTYDHVDISSPSIPSGLTYSQTTVSSILLEWNENISDFDFANFNLYRSLDNIEFELIETTSDLSYLDSELNDNSTYYYRLTSIDFTGNESSVSPTLSVTTDLDTTPPSDPTSANITAATNSIHLLWRPAAFGVIQYYRAYVTPVNLENEPVGDTFIKQVLSDIVYTSITDLENSQKYRIRLVSVGDNGIESNGIVLYSTPEFFEGPRDVVDMIVSDKIGDGFVSDTVLTVEWDPYQDPYDINPPVAHEIQIEEIDSDNSSVITSVWVREPIENFRDFNIYSYIDEGVIKNRSIRTRTVYFVTVRSIDSNGNHSVGRVARYKTRSFESPNPPSRLSVEQRDDQTIKFSWFNSTSIFKNNIINLIREDNSDPSNSLIIEEDKKIGFTENYIVSQDLIFANSTFRFFIKAVDEFGNESLERELEFDIPDIDNLPRPPAPSQVLGIANDSETILSWNEPNSFTIQGYRIYRSEQQITYESSDFSRIETVDSSTFSYTDYDVENGKTYAYFVTTIDIYNRESLNPIDDDYFDYNITLLTPNASGQIGTPSNLSVSLDGDNTGVDLSWSPTGGQFDGYEIFRSINNTYEFELIGTSSPSQTSYNDNDALIIAGTYYYIVRKFKNEADLFITESNIDVASSLFLGTVETSNGDIIIDQSGLREISNLEDPVREKSEELIREHKHEFYTRIDDRRINLGDIIRVDNWTTQDFQTYTTITSDLDQTFSYDVYLNGSLASEYNLLYDLDKDQGRITFEQRLAATDFFNSGNFPFDQPPELVIVFRGLAETQGDLPQERLGSLSSTQVISGLIDPKQLPDLDHEGRNNERLIPLQINTINVDNGYRFAPIAEDEIIGDGITWYDIMLAEGQEGDVLLGSNSDGLYTSIDFGATWTRQLSLVTPVIKFYYFSSVDLYFALTNRGVFASRGGSQGGFSIWREIRGMENAKIARGMAETPEGNIFCTSDLGVFKLVRDVGRNFYFWQQTPIFGPRSTESYDIIYDHVRDRIVVSNELGIFETSNAGLRWDFSDEMPDQRPVFQFRFLGNTLFCITQFIVWRRKTGEEEFERVAILRDADMMRKMVIWKNRLFITTDIGLLATVPGTDILNDEEFDFEIAFPQLNSFSHKPPPTSMNIIDDKMFVGTEEQLFLSVSPGSMSLQWEKLSNVLPTIYVDGVEQTIGFRYTTSVSDLRKFICFDEKQDIDSVVTIANQYRKFVAKKGGWASSNFISGVRLYLNGFSVNDWSVAERPAQAISEIILPEYNDRNSHKAGADIARDQLVNITTNLINTGEDLENPTLLQFDKINVSLFINSLDRFLSQIYPDARVIRQREGSSENMVPFTIPAFRVLMLSSNDNYKFRGLEDFGTYAENNSLEEDLGGIVSEPDVGGGIAPGDGSNGLGGSSDIEP